VSVSINILQSILRITYRTANPDEYAVYPRINVSFEVTHTIPIPAGGGAYNFMISDLKLSLSVLKDGLLHYVGELIPRQPLFILPSGGTSNIICDMTLDHYGLSQIEKLREGKDLTFRVEGTFVGEQQQQPQTKTATGFTLDFRMPKSDWIENILPRLKYKDVMLLEIPKFLEPKFDDVVTYVNDAWRQYSMGEYDKVLTECRKALETLSNKVKAQGFEKEIEDDQGKRKMIPDWDKLLGAPDLGDILGSINQKIWGFVAPSAHAGKAINKEDADFALMITHAIINLAIHKLS
jgi:hypothetical protein